MEDAEAEWVSMPFPGVYSTRGSLGRKEVSYDMNHRNMDVTIHMWLQGRTGEYCAVGWGERQGESRKAIEKLCLKMRSGPSH